MDHIAVIISDNHLDVFIAIAIALKFSNDPASFDARVNVIGQHLTGLVLVGPIWPTYREIISSQRRFPCLEQQLAVAISHQFRGDNSCWKEGSHVSEAGLVLTLW